MTTKLLLLFLFMGMGTFCGYAVMLSMRRRYTYLNGVCKIIGDIKRNVAYRKDSLSGMLAGVDCESAQLKKNVEEFIQYVDGKADKPQFSRGFLPKDIYDKAVDLFTSIGKSDGPTQIEQLTVFEKDFSKLCAESKKKYTDLGGVAVKLGFLLGLGVGILIL